MTQIEIEIISPSAKSVIFRGINTNYYEVGSGDCLICIPSWPFTAPEFFPLATYLKDHFRIIMVDLPGYGSTGKLKDAETIEGMAEFVNDFSNALGIGAFSLLGYSAGGPIALYYASKGGEKLRKIVVISGPYSPYSSVLGSLTSVITLTLAHNLKFLRDYLFRYHFNEKTLAKRIEMQLHVNENELHNNILFKRILAGLTRIDAETVINIGLDLATNNYSKIFSEITTSTLVITGGKDEEVYCKYSKQLANQILKNAIYVEIPDQMHYGVILYPKLFAKEILDFLTKDIKIVNN